jgi:hypothetical protein
MVVEKFLNLFPQKILKNLQSQKIFYRFIYDDKGLKPLFKNFVSKDILEMPFLDIYFCPFFTFQKTFQFSKSRFFPTYVVNFFEPFFMKKLEFPSICSIPSLSRLDNNIFKIT